MSFKGVSDFNKYKDLIKEYIVTNSRTSNTEIARLIADLHPNDNLNIQSFRIFIGKYRRNHLKESPVKVDVSSTTSSNSYNKKKSGSATQSFVLSAWNQDTGLMMDIDEYCVHYNLPRKDIDSYKLVSHTGTPFYNIVFKENISDLFSVEFEEVINSAVSSHIAPVKIKKKVTKLGEDLVDRLVYSDVHVGMCVNANGFNMYGGKWDENELMERCNIMVESVLSCKTSGELYIDDLGDFLDGWNAETTRGSHKLPQNMDNEKAFKVGLKFKMHLIDRLVPFFDTIISRNICDDNHAGSFAFLLNYAYKQIIKHKYNNSVQVVNQRRFIDHYVVGDHAIVTSHGKDSTNMKFGFKPHLDSKQIEKVDQYLKSEDVYKKSKYIRFCKGDSHQALFDMSGSDDFDYFNYPAFSPSSNWVQTNFKKGRSGFVIEHFNKFNEGTSIDPFWFKWKK